MRSSDKIIWSAVWFGQENEECDELEMRNIAFQEYRARNCQEIDESLRICCTEAERAWHLRCDELSAQKGVSNSTVNQLMVQIQELKDKVNSLRLRAALDYPTFRVNPRVFRVPEEWIAATLAGSLIHGTHGVHQDTFLVYSLEVNRLQRSLRIQRIWHRLLADWGQLLQAELRNKEKDWEKNRRDIQYQLLALPESSISYRRNLSSTLYDGKSEESDLGLAFRQIPWHLRFPVLEDQFQDWSMLLFRLSYKRNVVDQRSGGGQIRERSYDVAVNWRACTPWFWDTWCEDCVCFEKDYHESVLPKENYCGRAACSKIRPISSMMTDFYEHFSSYCSWSSSCFIRSIQDLYTRRWHSWFQYQMGPSSTICKSSTSGKCPGEFVSDENTWICSAADRTSNVWARSNNAKLSQIEHTGKKTHGSDDQDALLMRRLLQFSPRKWLWTSTIVLSCSEGADTDCRKRAFERHWFQWRKVLQEGKARQRAEVTSKKLVRIRRIIIGILPYVKITNLNRDATSATTVCSDTLRLMCSPVKQSKKSGGKGSVASLKESKQLGCVSQDTDPPKKSTLRKSGK